MSDDINNIKVQEYKYKKTRVLSDIVLPHDELCEQTVIGNLLGFFDKYSVYLNILTQDMFYIKKLETLFKAMQELNREGSVVDVVSVITKCRAIDIEITPFYIMSLTNNCPALTNYHVNIVYQKYLQRQLLLILESKKNDLMNTNLDDVMSLIDPISAEIANVISDRPAGEYETARSVSERLIRATQNKIENPEAEDLNYKIYLTGHTKFDKVISIIRDRVVTIAGYPSHGKSKFTQDLIFRLLENYPQEIAVDWVSTEEQAHEINMCYASSKIIEKPKDILTMNIDKNKVDKLIASYTKFKDFDVVFNSRIGQITKITNHFRDFVKRRPHKFNILVIDNILTLEESDGSVRNDDYIWKEIVRLRQDVNAIGNAMIICVHHYRKEIATDAEIKENAGRPMISMLKGSEACERSSNQVLLLNNMKLRKSLYLEYPEEDQELLRHLVIIDPGKNRNDNNDGDIMLRYFADLDYNLWQEIYDESN